MATVEELKVRLTANVDDLRKQLKLAEDALEDLGQQSDDADAKIKKVGSGNNSGIPKFGKQVSNTTPTLLEFNRVVQDAPFGIQGVANNITQLTQNFQSLSAQAGGSQKAFKLLLNSFLGPAGILFAISAATSLLVTFGDRLLKSSSLTSRFAKAAKDLVSSAQAEITVLRTLISVAQNENVSRTARFRAIERINKEYGEYLGNLDLESIKTEEVRKRVDALTTSLIKQAQARGAQKLIETTLAEDAEELGELILEQRRASRLLDQELAEIRNVDAFRNISGSQRDQIKQIRAIVNANNGLGQSYLNQATLAAGGLVRAQNAVKDFQAEVQENIAPLKALFESLTIEELLTDLKQADDIGEVVLTPRVAELPENNFRNLDNIFAVTPQAQKRLEARVTAFNKRIGEVLQASASTFVTPAVDDVTKRYQDFVNNVETIFSSATVSNAINDANSAIGQAIANGGNVFSAFGASILNSFGNFLSAFGQQLVQYGTAALAFSNVSKALLNPITATGAALAAIGIGSALSIAGSALSATAQRGLSANGVNGQGATTGVTGSNTTFSSQGLGNGTVVFRIEGQALVGVLNRTLDKNSRQGGTLRLS